MIMKYIIPLFIFLLTASQSFAEEQALKVHGIFRSNMVIQREKPIKIWGWATAGTKVTVKFGDKVASGTAKGKDGLWVVTFEAQKANIKGQTLTVTTGAKAVKMENILIGDVWVMNGQSNMAFGLNGVYQKHFEAAMPSLLAVPLVAFSA